MTRKVLYALFVAVLVVGLAAAQGHSNKMVRVEGWVVDEWCGKDNAKADGKGCTLECHKKGAALVFYDNATGEIYKLDKQEVAEKFVGREVGVFGTLDGAGNLAVGQFFEKKKNNGGEAEKKEG